ncbi:glycoside hydrolase family 36 protein [Fodinibius sp. SL11]|uniref:glycoside hydrolase family 36 protein n=1 Tax=Fodinibius sp. SL11 TaxID=3425690 RepID=UPI003F8856C5
MTTIRTNIRLLGATILVLFAFGCTNNQEPQITSGSVTLTFNELLHTKVEFADSKRELLLNEFQPSESVTINGEVLSNFKLENFHFESINNELGNGRRITITGNASNPQFNIQKNVIATAYESIPNLITTRVEYVNNGEQVLDLDRWKNNHYVLSALDDSLGENSFWSFQSASYPSRQDWILPIGQDFEQQNYQGMNASDYGGGTPVADVWRPDGGLAVGHIETEPQLISLPVNSTSENDGVELSVTFDTDSVSTLKYPHSIQPGDSVSTFETFLSTHTGDYYSSLRKYRKILDLKGIEFTDPPETAYEPIWCAWGYGRDFTLEKVLNTLPKVKELGFEWAVLDDGWQIAEGDWQTNAKFSKTTMKQFVDQVHEHDLKAKLWWAPLAADPGSRVHENESEMLLINKQGEYQKITWWDSHYLNPALKTTKEYHNQLVKKFMGDWGYDGLKIDGQHLNQVPPDYGNDKSQEYPEKSVEELPDLYNEIYNTAITIKSDAVVEICPCGASGSSFIMPHMNQPVSSDPLNSWQIRHKGKTYKALMGENAAYYGDHVELSDNQNDFASTVGIGGVIGSKFTWPESSAPGNEFLLTNEKEALVSKWMDIYKEYMLPKGEYRGELYDIGFDRPETHAIEKNGNLFYAFYADSFEGQVELRGLNANQEYELVNYETGEQLGVIKGSDANLETSFSDHLLVVAKPQE